MSNNFRQMRQRIHELKDKLDKQFRDVIGFCERLNDIRKATFMARQSARCLLTEEPFEAWEQIRDQAEFDAFRGLEEKQNTKRDHSTKGHVEKLITPQMRQRVIDIKKGLDDYASRIGEFISDLDRLKTFEAALVWSEGLEWNVPLESCGTGEETEDEELS
jgi:chromatin segregation and condensation protein Rec8/ScpA/Scc1 (kleisin family)